MSRLWRGVARATLVALSGGAMVAAASDLPGTAALRPRSAQATAPVPSLVPVESVSLSCPGPETEGLGAIPPVPGRTTVLAATAPAEALADVALPGAPGRVTLAGMPGAPDLGSVAVRGRVVTGELSGPVAGRVTATGALAPGVGAIQMWLQAAGNDRALNTTPCLPPRPDIWLVGGGGESTRRERIVVANPGANAVTVDVVVHGGAGPVPSVNGSHVAVPPRGRVTLLLDAIAGGESTPAVHVTASGGAVTAVLDDSWVDGSVGRGGDDAAPADGPSLEQVLPAVFVDGPAKVRVVVPGPDEAVVQTRLLTPTGPQPLPADGVARVAGGTVRDIDLGALPAGAYAVQVRADQPVVAGAMLERRPGGPHSDLAWTTSVAPIPVIAGGPLPPGARGQLMLVATADAAGATVVAVSREGVVSSQDVAVPADSVAVVDISGLSQVWVRQRLGTLRAGYLASLDDRSGPLFSTVVLPPLAVSATRTPVRQVQR